MSDTKHTRTFAGLALLLSTLISTVPDATAKRKQVKRIYHFDVMVKAVTKSGRTSLLKVGEIDRTRTGNVIARGVPAPSLDALADNFVKQWKAYQPQKNITITEEIYSDSGMRPSKDKHQQTFRKGDALYSAAAVRAFVERHGYETLGLSTIKFIEYDTETSKAGPGGFIHDEALKNYGFRKGTKMDYDQGKSTIWIYAKVRPANMGSPTYVLRASKSRPSLALAQNHDAGTQEIGQITIYKDGRIAAKPSYAGDVFTRGFGRFSQYDRDIEVSVIEDGKDWKHFKVGNKSPLLLEAYVVELLEHSKFYRVSPAIDPVLFE